MKRFFTILALAAMVVGCSKDVEVAQQPTLYTLTGYSDINTRTAFGTPNDSSIPFVWSAGDKIWVGNQQSSPLETGGDSSATFTVATEPQEGATIYYNMKSLGSIANIPAEQDANNSLGENGDFGYATVSNGSFTLQHATAYLWFDVTRANGELEGATLESITIDASDATIAGTAKWNGSAFNTPTQSKSVITLTVGKELATANEGVMAAAVVLPTELSKLTLTYEFTVGSETKYYKKVIEKSRTLESGRTYRIAVEGLKASDLWDNADYTLRILTFEDNTESWEYYNLGGHTDIYNWSDLIPQKQYGDILNYGETMFGSDVDYWWYDEGNTNLKNVTSEYGFASGGHTISNYYVNSYDSDDKYDLIAYFYGQDYVDEWLEQDQKDSGLGWFLLQLSVYDDGGAEDAGRGGRGHNGSDNFAVQFGYMDIPINQSMCWELPSLTFEDGEARVIDHMWVTNTAYTLNQLMCGVKSEDNNTFMPPGDTPYMGPTEDTWFKIVATGYDENENMTGEVYFFLCEEGVPVTEWSKWDLSELGAVVKVEFNIIGSEDMSGGYGLTMPAYFAYDDVAVRVTK